MRRNAPDTWTVLQRGEDGFAAVAPIQGGTVSIIASWGGGWDHVSISHRSRCPTWEEMQAVKDALFDPEECAVQFHPPRSRYVNRHPNCLHLWRHQEQAILMPPLEFI